MIRLERVRYKVGGLTLMRCLERLLGRVPNTSEFGTNWDDLLEEVRQAGRSADSEKRTPTVKF